MNDTPRDEDRCGYQPGALRCVREHHPDQPHAHIRVADPADSHSEGDEQWW